MFARHLCEFFFHTVQFLVQVFLLLHDGFFAHPEAVLHAQSVRVAPKLKEKIRALDGEFLRGYQGLRYVFFF